MKDSRSGVRLAALGMVNALGSDTERIWNRVLQCDSGGMVGDESLFPGRRVPVGRVSEPLPEMPEGLERWRCRSNALALRALHGIHDAVRDVLDRRGPERVGVVIGSTTYVVAGSEGLFGSGEAALGSGRDFDIALHEMGGLSRFVAAAAGAAGPAYTVSTACSSSAKALACARGLLRTGVCDAVIAGGADVLCRLTVQGFGSLELLSDSLCIPLSRNRAGLNIGEAAALFLMDREPGGIRLLGAGESSDAHHMSAPEPEGRGAEYAMAGALRDAGLGPEAVGYVNLHGTGTRLNDLSESRAVARLLPGVPASSCKPLVGHTLGAAGAVEAGFCWLALAHATGRGIPLPPHRWDGVPDPELPPIPLVEPGGRTAPEGPGVLLSNSFGFGGNNCALLFGGRP